jgi:predicted O-methyltransferase YrrM
MHHPYKFVIWLVVGGYFCLMLISLSAAQENQAALDQRVSHFLGENRSTWSAWNVPYEDGKILFDLVVKGRYRNILEIGTSTGHSTIWLAWAASKNGGKVTTIEIDRGRHEEALDNFKKAGVSSYIQGIRADAHKAVPQLPGPYDFIFCDADKEWYAQYFLDLKGKLAPGGCFTAHNVLWSHDPHIRKFLEVVRSDPAFQTRIERGSGEGISISCRIKE